MRRNTLAKRSSGSAEWVVVTVWTSLSDGLAVWSTSTVCMHEHESLGGIQPGGSAKYAEPGHTCWVGFYMGGPAHTLRVVSFSALILDPRSRVVNSAFKGMSALL